MKSNIMEKVYDTGKSSEHHDIFKVAHKIASAIFLSFKNL